MIHSRRSAAVPAAVLALVTLAACGGDQAPPPAAPAPSASPSSGFFSPPSNSEHVGATMAQAPASTDVQPAPTAGPTATAAPPTPPPDPSDDVIGAGLDESQIVGVARTMTDQAMRIAQMGEKRASSRSVKLQAHDEVNGYTTLRNELEAIAAKLQITPTESNASIAVRTHAADGLRNLRDAHGQQFERQYLAAQVRSQHRALAALDSLAARASAPELQTELLKMRAKVETFLRENEALQPAGQ